MMIFEECFKDHLLLETKVASFIFFEITLPTENIFSKLFTKEKGKTESEDIVQKKHNFFRNAVKKNASDIKFTCFLFNSAQYLVKNSGGNC